MLLTCLTSVDKRLIHDSFLKNLSCTSTVQRTAECLLIFQEENCDRGFAGTGLLAAMIPCAGTFGTGFWLV